MATKRRNATSSVDPAAIEVSSANAVVTDKANGQNSLRRLPCSHLPGCERFLTRTRLFQAAVSAAFDFCDDSGDGIVDESELYAGLLLVHLNLAKYAGPSACYPPTRAVCDRLFILADRDRSGGIDRNEFCCIVEILCAQILSRMLVYYVVLILAVPVLATFVVKSIGIPSNTYFELVIRESVSSAVFFVAVPLLWNMIDARHAGGERTVVSGDASSRANSRDSTEDPVAMLPLRRQEQRHRRYQRKSIRLKEMEQQQQHGNDEIPI
ncbi:unnamed protein product [Pseudo-nitzschia multistriata]|uniref:EF-hand domain-containing protein n=1 Tax=Pseudo-nitzschia multistriata TaxID=183589 RepID=A0A448ZA28_9STRA|nr:unnamed protein product [Pseudo-nitzschia multistriata]